jgi:hypothetical protein
MCTAGLVSPRSKRAKQLSAARQSNRIQRQILAELRQQKGTR